MSTEKDTKKDSKSDQISEIFKDKSTTSIVVATVILLLLSFFAFRYFGSNDINDSLNGTGASDIVLEGESDENSSTVAEIQSEVKGLANDAENFVKEEVNFEEPEFLEEPQAQETPTPEVTAEITPEVTPEVTSTISDDNNDSNVTPTPEDSDQVQDEDKKGFRKFLAGLFVGKKVVDSVNDKNSNQPTDENSTDSSIDEPAVGGAPIDNNSTWVANDLTPSSLQGETHNVQQGDTLWEIAEAYYGSGAEWTKIAQANNVSYNMNGNPLIYAGTTITIPQM